MKTTSQSPGMKQEDIIKKYFTIRSYFLNISFLVPKPNIMALKLKF